MAGSENSKQDQYTYLNQMSTEALKELLDAKVAAGDEDELLYQLLEVIEKRDAESPMGELANVDRAWEAFQQYYNVPEGDGRSLFDDGGEEFTVSAVEKASHQKPHHYSFPHLLSAAVAAVVVISLLIPAASGSKLWKIMGQWTQDIFTFADMQDPAILSGDNPITGAVPASSDQYESLQEALDAYGITERLAPTWLPDGYECVEVNTTEFTMSTDFYAFYKSGDDIASISITMYQEENSPATNYEKDITNVTTYIVSDKIHYIFENNDQVVAAWYAGRYECAVCANVTIDEMKKIVDSIYEE